MADMRAFRNAVTEWAAGGPGGAADGSRGAAGGPGGAAADGPGTAPGARGKAAGEVAGELAGLLPVRTVVLLEGPSDVAAVEALAERTGRDLAAEGVCVLSMGGAMNIARYAGLLGPPGLGLALAGLCDERERGFYDRGLERAHASGRNFFVCVSDLEDELVRALGVPRVEEVVRVEGDLPAWRTFVRQPAQRDRSPRQRMRRFLGTKKGRKIRYGRLLAEALDPAQVPVPLRRLLTSL
ncbi:TOPRIM nucleotidyl transferase/hydrolase domain-containing protein [Streptomyces griseoviridis]|uniref:TOPRIM nucleotidyl transferase/hydrolase domain-containing protein n=1 Tax=Streptomyces griseoviridis TaxID=45398 RepID=UPI0033F36378